MEKPEFLEVGQYVKVAGVVGVIGYVAETDKEIAVKVISPKAASRMQPNNCDWLVYDQSPELWKPATKEDFSEAAKRELDRVKYHFEVCSQNTKSILAAYG